MKNGQQFSNWIICFDPDSGYVYSTDGDNIIVETKVHQFYLQKCQEALSDMDYILYDNDELAHWLQNSKEIDSYRRRSIPSYLLHPRQQKYRRYLAQQNLGFSFSNVYTIILNGKMAFQDSYPNIQTFSLQFNLMTSANEAISMILKHLQIENNNSYILQVVGYDEYIFGEEPLLQFIRIRNIIRETQILNVLIIEYRPEIIYDYPPIFQREKNNKQLIEKWDQYFSIPIFIWYPKRKINQQGQVCQNRISNNKIQSQYSGHCDFQFSFKLVKIDQLKNLFESDYEKLGKKRATFNGFTKLKNITKQQEYQQTIENNNLINFKQHSHHANEKIIPKEYLSFGGVENNFQIQKLQEIFELNFEPYLIAVRISLYQGNKLLSPGTIITTQKIPFCFNPTFNYQIKFPQIKYSMLPQETRLTFEVIIYSTNGQYQIIGSSSVYLFQSNMELLQGVQTINLWPFYEIDPRISCSGEYKGQVTLDQDYNRARSKNYSYLTFKMDTFCTPLKWSLRDHTTQIQYEQNKNCLSTKFYAQLVLADNELKYQIENQRLPNIFLQQKQFDLNSHNNSIISLNKRKGISIVVNQDKQKTTGLEYARQSIQNLSAFLQQMLQTKKSLNYLKENIERLGLYYPYKDIDQTPKTQDLAYLQTLLTASSLDKVSYTEQEKFLLMISRHHYKTLPHALKILLKAVNWADPKQVREIHSMIKQWVPLSSEQALLLLDSQYADECVRLYAVERISLFSDDELGLYLLQLSQALQFEKNILNPLGEFLLERASANPFQIGQELFWLLKSQLKLKQSFIRYSMILEQLLMISGSFREKMAKQCKLHSLLNSIALKIKSKVSGNEITQKSEMLKKELQHLITIIPYPFTMPLDARMQIASFNIEESKVLNSKKLPLLLVMKSEYSENEQIQVIFKNGDDLKQDMLTLQMIKIIDRIWLSSGFDFKMKPYKVLSTDDQVGMIEVVVDSENISTIHQRLGVLGAFDEKAILNFIKMTNPNQDEFAKAKENFVRSCAGYCVVTYVLGIGDRHSGNIMIKSSGHIFHIDFGHFLGNFKSKFGINRERAKFVLTSEMQYMMDGQNSKIFKQFEEHCVNAYNLIRKHGKWLVDLFLMNLSAGMPELQSADDLKYLQDRLALNLSEQEATTKFKLEILVSINDNWRRMDNFLHNIKRNG